MADIDDMEAGPELDLLIAEKVMGYLIIDLTPPCPHDAMPYVPHIAKISENPLQLHFHRPLGNPEKNYNWGMWQPSINMLDAMTVWEKWTTRACFYHDAYCQWQVKLDCCRNVFESCKWEGWGDTLPEAICRAALKAVSKKPIKGEIGNAKEKAETQGKAASPNS